LPSCSAIEALDRQEPFINQTLASSALAMLARLFRFAVLWDKKPSAQRVIPEWVQPGGSYTLSSQRSDSSDRRNAAIGLNLQIRGWPSRISSAFQQFLPHQLQHPHHPLLPERFSTGTEWVWCLCQSAIFLKSRDHLLLCTAFSKQRRLGNGTFSTPQRWMQLAG
jgi:hypothetical protein